MTPRLKKRILVGLAAALFVALLVLELFKNRIFTSELYGENLYSAVTRLIGGFACMIFIYTFLSAKMLSFRTSQRALLTFLPCMAVAINNFPFITFFTGRAHVDASAPYVALYALVCLSVGFFEEMAFRGCIFTVILGRRGKRPIDIFISIVLSSAVFGAVHLVNLFTGASPVAVLLQVGYSFLIGGMCSVILIKTGNVWYCVLLHAVYNFTGGVVPNCGGGEIWDTPTVILTAAVAVLVACYVIYLLVKITPDEIENLVNDGRAEEQNNSEEIKRAD